eukprot:857896-Rhodomonas_salina.2
MSAAQRERDKGTSWTLETLGQQRGERSARHLAAEPLSSLLAREAVAHVLLPLVVEPEAVPVPLARAGDGHLVLAPPRLRSRHAPSHSHTRARSYRSACGPSTRRRHAE